MAHKFNQHIFCPNNGTFLHTSCERCGDIAGRSVDRDCPFPAFPAVAAVAAMPGYTQLLLYAVLSLKRNCFSSLLFSTINAV